MTCLDCSRLVLTRRGSRCPECRRRHRLAYLRERTRARRQGTAPPPRLCACGAVLAKWAQSCKPCQAQVTKANWRTTAARRKRETATARRENLRRAGIADPVPGDLSAAEIEAQFAAVRAARRRTA